MPQISLISQKHNIVNPSPKFGKENGALNEKKRKDLHIDCGAGAYSASPINRLVKKSGVPLSPALKSTVPKTKQLSTFQKGGAKEELKEPQSSRPRATSQIPNEKKSNMKVEKAHNQSKKISVDGIYYNIKMNQLEELSKIHQRG